MDHQGDCSTNSKTGAFQECGVDIDASGNGGACPGGVGNAYLCAPAGVILSSTCHSATTIAGECTTTGYAGAGGKIYGGPGIFINTNGANGVKPGDLAKWTPTPVSTGGVAFDDPTKGTPQPPIAAGTSAIGACGYPGGIIPAASKGTQTLGPLQFYSYKVVGGVKIPDGKPLVLPANATFDPTASGSAGCPGDPVADGVVFTSGASQNSAFPTFILYGGINGGSGKPSVNFGAGQYILAGTDGSNTITSGANGPNVISNFGGTITGAASSTVGTMFILTDTNYLGGGAANPTSLSQQIVNVPGHAAAGQTLTSDTMGSVDLKDATVTLNGFNKNNYSGGTPIPQFDGYDGMLLWQDRRNSTVEYNKAPTAACPSPECTADDGTVVSGGLGPAGCKNCASTAQLAENHVTATSPGLSVDDGNGTKTLNGVIYQPRGAWFLMNPGTGQVNNSPLQILTGQLICGTACGNTQVTLISPAVPFIRYITTLIQ
jgi:hypothetical protein